MSQVEARFLHLTYQGENRPRPLSVTPLQQTLEILINTLTSRLIQAVCKKQLDRTWLCAGISPLRLALRTWAKCQKTRQVL